MFSIVMPMDTNRLEQFVATKQEYDKMPEEREFLIPTREVDKVQKFIEEHRLMKDVKFLPYVWTSGFNCSMALNLGVKNAKYDSIIITCPEVKPTTPVLTQLSKLIGQNVVCYVTDTDENNEPTSILVNSEYRSETPAMYFLAMFNKADIYKINGWDEDFMKGYAYEDSDFGTRWVKAGIPFIVRDEILAIHQYHPRIPTIDNGWGINESKYQQNKIDDIIFCKNGLEKTE